MQNTPRNIHAKLLSNWFSSVGKEVLKNCYKQWTQSDDNSSHGTLSILYAGIFRKKNDSLAFLGQYSNS